MKMLETIQNEIKLQKEELKTVQLSITNDINNNINKKFIEIEEKYRKLNDKLEKQEKQIDYLERETNKRNLIFFGIPDDENNYLQLQSKVINMISTTMRIPCERYDFEALRRVGKRGEKPRPVLVTLSTLGLKIEILRSKKCLANSSFYVK